MSVHKTRTLNNSKIPKSWVFAVIIVCTLPYLLNLLGLDFGTTKYLPDTTQSVPAVDTMFYKLSGAFSHTLLEWSAFCTAIFTVILAFVHFTIKRDVTTPIIGLALFFAGCMGAFHHSPLIWAQGIYRKEEDKCN